MSTVKKLMFFELFKGKYIFSYDDSFMIIESYRFEKISENESAFECIIFLGKDTNNNQTFSNKYFLDTSKDNNIDHIYFYNSYKDIVHSLTDF